MAVMTLFVSTLSTPSHTVSVNSAQHTSIQTRGWSLVTYAMRRSFASALRASRLWLISRQRWVLRSRCTEIERFIDVNARGTGVLLEQVIAKGSRVRKLVVASTMSLYGEGRCHCPTCGAFDPRLRSGVLLAAKDFEVHCPRCKSSATPIPTPEDAPIVPTTVYAITKRDQEELVMTVGTAYGMDTIALRLFNVYGPRQSLSNPYTGVAAISSGRMLNGHTPVVFEDGQQTRDFTHVADVAEAFERAIAGPCPGGSVMNVGAGRPFTLLRLGELIAGEIGVEWRPQITSSFRKGDIRHCTSDTTRLAEVLGFRPRVRFEDGIKDLVHWVKTQSSIDCVDHALSELTAGGL